MAWRDSRRSRSRLLLFTSSIVLGVAALVAINSFDDNLRDDIQGQARELLGADLMIRSRQALNDSTIAFMDSIGDIQANEQYFASMVYFPKSEGTRLVQIRTLEGDFPFYGTIQTKPIEAAETFRDKKQALVDQGLMIQYDAKIGDSIKVGLVMFEIAGELLRVPGQNGISATVTAPVYIPQKYMEATGLAQKGSRINYLRYYKFEDDRDVEEMMEAHRPRMRALGLSYDTVEEKKEDVGRAFKDLTDFLNLVGFVALLLGCVGVASAVHVYVKEKLNTVAILRCLGASGQQAFMIFLLQIAVMGFLGSVAGAFLGSEIQTLLPAVLADFLPFEVSFGVSWGAIIQGIVVGIAVSLLFAFLPLLSIRRVSPLNAIRSTVESNSEETDYLRWGIYGIIGLFILGFSYWQIGLLRTALIFTASLIGAFLLLAGLAKGTMMLVRKYFPVGWSYIWRQSLANLYRPNNQTLTLIVSIGLGTLLIATLYFVQDMLVDRIAISEQGNRPNMVMFDIQSNQIEELEELTESYDLPILQSVPIVTMRLDGLKGVSKAEALKDTTKNRKSWLYNREYRVTFRDSLIDSEKIVEGEWYGKADSDIYVSLEEDFGRRDMDLEIGDELIFNVQGVPIKTKVGSFREVDYERVQTNFLVLFPSGVLEDAPQFHVLMTKVPDIETSAKLQQQVTPGISQCLYY